MPSVLPPVYKAHTASRCWCRRPLKGGGGGGGGERQFVTVTSRPASLAYNDTFVQSTVLHCSVTSIQWRVCVDHSTPLQHVARRKLRHWQTCLTSLPWRFYLDNRPASLQFQVEDSCHFVSDIALGLTVRKTESDQAPGHGHCTQPDCRKDTLLHFVSRAHLHRVLVARQLKEINRRKM